MNQRDDDVEEDVAVLVTAPVEDLTIHGDLTRL